MVSVFAETLCVFQVMRRQLQYKHTLQRERVERATAAKFHGVKVRIFYKLILGIVSLYYVSKINCFILIITFSTGRRSLY